MGDCIEHIVLNYNDLDITFFNVNINIENRQTEDMHRHNFYEVHYSDNGYFTYEFGNKTVTLSPKRIMIIPPQTLHNTNYSKTSFPTVVSFLITSNGDIKNYNRITEALSAISRKPIDFSPFSNEEFLLLSNSQLYGTFLGNCKLKQVASSFVYKIFSLALNEKDFAVDENADKMLLIDNLLNYSHVSLKDIAKLTNYSERQISRLIKKHYGMTLSEIKKKNKGSLNEKREIAK